MSLVEPKVFLLAETQITHGVEGARGYPDFLRHLEVGDWQTDAASDAERLMETAGKLCYMSFSTDLNKNLTKVGARNNHDYLQKGIIGTKHGSVLEHASVTLAFMDVSRVFTHELVRHRVGSSYSQVSGRYVRSDVIDYWLPSVIKKDEVAAVGFAAMFEKMELAVMELSHHFKIDQMKTAAEFTLKKILTSAFRRIIGNGQANHIIATFNHRTLRHLIELRTSVHAEEEIRLVFNQVFDIVKDRYPALYADAKPTMVEGYNEILFEHSKV